MTDLNEVAKFKNFLEPFGITVHFHDTCGGQSFSYENADEKGKRIISEYFAERGKNVVFSEYGNNFTVK